MEASCRNDSYDVRYVVLAFEGRADRPISVTP